MLYLYSLTPKNKLTNGTLFYVIAYMSSLLTILVHPLHVTMNSINSTVRRL